MYSTSIEEMKDSGLHVENVGVGHQKPEKDNEMVDISSRSSKDGSISSEELEEFRNIDEKKLIRKIDRRLLPLFTILYLLSFLDRGNIGNAKIEGLAEDLNLHGTQYNICLTIFFVFYASLEIPSNIILKHIRPKIFIPLTMALWSVVMTLMGTVTNYNQLLATRALLGIFEAPSFPGISFLLSMYYKKQEIMVREAIFFSAASIAGAFSGLLAAAISKMDGVGGYEGWRWIFILEGLLTFIVSVLSFWIFPDYPDKALFLTESERKFVVYRVKHATNFDGVTIKNKEVQDEFSTPTFGEDNSNDSKYIWAVFKDWQCWGQLVLYYGVCVPLYGVSLFTPTIIKNLGYTSTISQLMSVPIYIVAAIFSIIQAFISTKVGVRSPFLLLNYTCMAIGYIICITGNPVKRPGVIYAGCYIMALGIYPAFPMVVIWASNNLSGSYKRAVGMAFQIGVGNFSGAFASNFYRTQDAPKYILGHGLELGFIGLGFVGLGTLFIGYNMSNRLKKKRLNEGYYNSYTDEELMKLGDKNPYFTYRL